MAKGRQYESQQVHYIRGDVAFNTSGVGTGVVIGVLPKGAIITGCVVRVAAAFNAATTNVLTVGTGTDSGYDNIVAAAGVDEGAVGTTRVTPNVAELTAEDTVVVKYAQTGTAATAGAATVIVEYVVDNDG